MRIFFATDMHGSETCFRKFLRAKNYYNCDVLIMGGDYIAKTLIYVKRESPYWVLHLGDKQIRLNERAKVDEICAALRSQGHAIYEEEGIFSGKSKSVIFEQVVDEQLRNWMKIVNAYGIKKPIYFVPGNDDPFFSDRLLQEPFVNIDARHIKISDKLAILGVGGSNPTPWHTEREYTEDQLSARIKLAYDPELAHCALMLVSYAPPKDSGLDLAPALRPDLSYELTLGMNKKVPVGSSAVRAAIDDLRPFVGLFGHVHESRGFSHLNGTLCLNPGSVFWTGRLLGCIIEIVASKVTGFQLTEG